MAGLETYHLAKRFERRRASSYDRSGGNRDHVRLDAGQSHEVWLRPGPGIVRHIWLTLRIEHPATYRDFDLEITFDEAEEPQVRSSIADFFCFGHGLLTDVDSIPIQVSRQPHLLARPYSGSMNTYFPMPFSESARFVFRNRTEQEAVIFYYIDWEHHANMAEPPLYFHATVREEKPGRPRQQREIEHGEYDSDLLTTDPAENYTFLKAEDHEGHFAGLVLNIECRPDDEGKWWEGDDMFIIDSEPWPPRIHGTGTEDYFNLAWGFRSVECRPQYGITWLEKPDWAKSQIDGRFTMYRFHIDDPIQFRSSIHGSLEHGHANDCTAHYRSTAFWYGRLLPGS